MRGPTLQGQRPGIEAGQLGQNRSAGGFEDQLTEANRVTGDVRCVRDVQQVHHRQVGLFLAGRKVISHSSRFSSLSLFRNRADVTETQSRFDRATGKNDAFQPLSSLLLKTVSWHTTNLKKKYRREPFSLEFGSFTCAFVSSLHVLQQHPSEVNYKKSELSPFGPAVNWDLSIQMLQMTYHDIVSCWTNLLDNSWNSLTTKYT